MAKLAAQLKNKFFGLVGRITSCARAHKDAAAGVAEPKPVASQHVEIRSRGGAPHVDGGAKGHINNDVV
ncbi:hypothetical protein GQ55_6G048000 [Panicum hallii var. hallii]|jgi:hypothetical protein|uniref:Uncharacterized protein n=2 Tax=Panicum hallii TaxID=206008 RepID=A0A2T7D419_9POAL|nr:uncharacterized protein LOC112898505 [Panicum hallii]PAN33818.1 hypothetical protein PAHAL_6G048700 [Panicum hallii]PUZ50300.1 hypothetical protein GQ55_6G048000 [Panicum hallii var. hallii]